MFFSVRNFWKPYPPAFFCFKYSTAPFFLFPCIIFTLLGTGWSSPGQRVGPSFSVMVTGVGHILVLATLRFGQSCRAWATVYFLQPQSASAEFALPTLKRYAYEVYVWIFLHLKACACYLCWLSKKEPLLAMIFFRLFLYEFCFRCINCIKHTRAAKIKSLLDSRFLKSMMVTNREKYFKIADKYGAFI